MKKTYSVLKVFSILLFVIFLFSCRKILEEIKSKLPGNETPTCRITQIDLPQGDEDSLHLQITYNANGDPVSIKQPADDTYELFSRDFNYDSNNHLSYTSEFTDWGYGATTYYYDSLGRIDSLHSSYGEDEELYVKFEYDDQNRIIKETQRLYFLEYFQHKTILTYEYDNSANLIGAGPFDNKTSLLKTNKLWMFFTRNYSMNNSLDVVNYNLSGFPTVFGHSPMNFVQDPLSRINLSQSKIHYACE
jgi:hypothetical protein